MKRISITFLAMVLLTVGCGEEPTSVLDLPLAPLAPQVGSVPWGNYVPTPAGWWHRSCVHAIPRGAIVFRDQQVRREDGTTYQLPQCQYPAFPRLRGQANAGRGRGPSGGPEPGDWVMDADDELTGSNSYRHLEAKWVVPAKPTGSYVPYDLYYTFPALQPHPEREIHVILQPVLQYGEWPPGDIGETDSWVLSSWRCDRRPGGNCDHSEDVIPVSPGDSIYGDINAAACIGDTCTWTVVAVEMESNDRSELMFSDDDSIYNYAVGGAVEVVNLDNCNQFPVLGVFYSAISLKDTAGSVTPSWTHDIQGYQPDCDFDMNSDSTWVDLLHNPPPPPPPLSVYIEGDLEVAPDEECAWQAYASGGTLPYSYNWWGALYGSTQNIYGIISQSSHQWVEVTDAASQADTAHIYIEVDEEYECEYR